MKYDLALLTTIVAVTLSGCAKATDSSSELEGGTWKTDCIYVSSDSAYEIRTAVYSGGSYQETLEAYATASCSSKVLVLTEKGTYVIGGAGGAGSDSKELDKTLVDLIVTPMTTSAAANYNSLTYCGSSNWASGTSKSVLGLTCGSQAMATAGAMFYDVYSIASLDIPGYVTKGALSFGYTDATYDGSTPAKRPQSTTAIDYFKR